MISENLFQLGDIKDHYKFEKTLGEGSFGLVKKAIKKKTGEEFAIKILEKSDMGMEDLYALQTEIEILAQIDHPNIVKLFEIYEDRNRFYMVFELMTGGELFAQIIERDHYSEKEACDILRPIIDAIRYCHNMGIAHRDLKPENILYASIEPGSIVKISDFGLAKFCTQDKFMTTQCGTPNYLAPEVIQGKGYDCSIDYWSLGIILYILLCGFPPFYHDDESKLYEMISKAEVEFPSPYWDDISDIAKDLIRKILVSDPTKRIKADEILNHPWMIGEKTPRKSLKKATEKIKEYRAKRAIKKASTVIAVTKKFQSILNKHA